MTAAPALGGYVGLASVTPLAASDDFRRALRAGARCGTMRTEIVTPHVSLSRVMIEAEYIICASPKDAPGSNR